jgi:thymidine phosphorylase
MRDVTGTVPSLPLITSSIMSKKLALGADHLVLDVKWGRGAFSRTVDDAIELAAALAAVARDVGVGVAAVITDMNQPLARTLGTACEVRAAIEVLAGGGDGPLREVSLRLAREAMVLQGEEPEAAEAELRSALDDGRAIRKWREIVVAHGGDPDPDALMRPQVSIDIQAENEGWVTGVAADTLGWVAVEIGSGRRARDERLAHGAGLEVHARIGDRVERGQRLATVFVGDREVDADAAVERVRSAFEIGEAQVEPPELILGTVDELERPGTPRSTKG